VDITQINQLESSTLQKLAPREVSANGRNWYLTKSLEVQGLIEVKPSQAQITETILSSSIRRCFMLMSVNLNYKAAEGKNQLVLFHFVDINGKFAVEIRNGIVEVNFNWPEKIDSLNVELIVQIKTELIWKQIIAKLKTPMQALDDEDIIIKDKNEQDNPEGILQFLEFLLMFAS
jgi:alkyl sulfatase BDS1-like metallo-beta-lactamase superfamily hydrolase